MIVYNLQILTIRTVWFCNVLLFHLLHNISARNHLWEKYKYCQMHIKSVNINSYKLSIKLVYCIIVRYQIKFNSQFCLSPFNSIQFWINSPCFSPGLFQDYGLSKLHLSEVIKVTKSWKWKIYTNIKFIKRILFKFIYHRFPDWI